MAQYIFPDANTQDVCLLQSTTGFVNLVLNGNLASGGAVSFITQGYSRQLSFTSANDLSSATFAVHGTQNGEVVTENVTGPNATTVYSTEVYDTVTAITSSVAVSGINVGTGYLGFFQLLQPAFTGVGVLNYNFTLGSTFGTNVIGTTVYGTLDNIVNNGSTFADLISGNVGTLNTIKALGTQAYYIYPNNTTLYKYILVELTGSTSTLGNTTTLTFLQVT